MSSSSVVPVVLWGSTPPSHCISCIITTYDQKTVVTGSTDGQLGIWDLRFADDGEIKVSLREPGVYTGGDLGLVFFPKKRQVITFFRLIFGRLKFFNSRIPPYAKEDRMI